MRTSKGETKTSLKKGAWSVEEDNKLIAYINRYGIWNWSHMPKFAGLSRSGKSCRLRWMNYLKPDLKKGRFSEEEEQSILHFHSILGNRWSAIARKLPGRSDNEIKNYWHTNLKKHVANKQAVKKSKQTKINTPPCSESDNNLDKTQESANQSEDDNSISISSSPSSNNYEVEYATPDIGSPGTIEDLQCFWRELYPLEDLEIGNLDQELMFLDNVFQESYDDPIGPWGFCNDDYEMITPRSSV